MNSVFSKEILSEPDVKSKWIYPNPNRNRKASQPEVSVSSVFFCLLRPKNCKTVTADFCTPQNDHKKSKGST